MDNHQFISAAAPKPAQVVASAKILEDAGDLAGARALLLAHEQDWPRLPPFYDALLGRLCVALGDWEAAVNHLVRARNAMGEAAPVHLRRNLGLALLHTGRVEGAGREFTLVRAAGGAVAKPAMLTAIQAFEHAADPASGAAFNPYIVLAQAELLIEARSPQAAIDLLSGEAQVREHAPGPYEAALGRVALQLKDLPAAAAHLERACAAWQGEVPGKLRQLLGSTLLQLGNWADAGRALSLALDSGTAAPTTDMRLAINAYREDLGDRRAVDTSFGRNTTFIDPDRRVLYLAIPKNAVGVLKATMVLNGRHRADFLASGMTVHEFASRLTAGLVPQEALTSAQYFRFVVLRDPTRRILSGYLDAFVHPAGTSADALPPAIARTIREAQSALGIDADLGRSISFAEFVRYLSVARDVQLNANWLPQSVMAGTDLSRFDHVGKVERLRDTLEVLARRFGWAAARQVDVQAHHGGALSISHSHEAVHAQPYNALPAELAAFASGLPMPETFFTPELRNLLMRRYADDFALYRAA